VKSTREKEFNHKGGDPRRKSSLIKEEAKEFNNKRLVHTQDLDPQLFVR
jgi:hypothetical protein